MNLEQMHLNNNKITEIKGLETLTNLKWLDLDFNPIGPNKRKPFGLTRRNMTMRQKSRIMKIIKILNEQPMQILKLKFAQGEISKEEFLEKKKLLEE